MELAHLNQARLFLSQRMMVLHSHYGKESVQDFYEFYRQYLIGFSDSIEKTFTLNLVLFDDGKTIQLLNQLPLREREYIPCSYEQYLYLHEKRCSKFFFHSVTVMQLEQFLDHLSCFVALYLEEVSNELALATIILSTPSRPGPLFSRL